MSSGGCVFRVMHVLCARVLIIVSVSAINHNNEFHHSVYFNHIECMFVGSSDQGFNDIAWIF
jgi:hypothetical protein